jgi:hypothetical protein
MIKNHHKLPRRKQSRMSWIWLSVTCLNLCTHSCKIIKSAYPCGVHLAEGSWNHHSGVSSFFAFRQRQLSMCFTCSECNAGNFSVAKVISPCTDFWECIGISRDHVQLDSDGKDHVMTELGWNPGLQSPNYLGFWSLWLESCIILQQCTSFPFDQQVLDEN